MPGPVSDSYDPEFGTGANAEKVRQAIRVMVDRLTRELGETRRPILDVVAVRPGEHHAHALKFADFTEEELRIMRFGLERSIDTI